MRPQLSGLKGRCVANLGASPMLGAQSLPRRERSEGRTQVIPTFAQCGAREGELPALAVVSFPAGFLSSLTYLDPFSHA